MSNDFITKYFDSFSDLIKKIDIESINKAIAILKELKKLSVGMK